MQKEKNIVGKITKNHYEITKEALFRGIEKKNHRELKRILESGIDVNIRDKDGSTPLINAAYYNDIEAVKILISFNANLELFDYDGYTALMYAAMNNCKEAGEYLLSKGAIVNAKNNIDGRTAADIAHEYHPSDNDYFLSDKSYSCDIFRYYYRNLAIEYSYGTIINLRKLKEDFLLRHSIEIDIEQVNELVRDEIHQSITPEKKIKVLSDDELQIVPSKRIKREFLNRFIKEQETGTVISIKDLKHEYKKEFNCSLSTKFIIEFIDAYNAYPKEFNIKTLQDNTQIQLLPTSQDARTVISDYFSEKEIGYEISLNNISEQLFHNCLTDTEIRNFINTYRILNNLKKLEIKNNNVLVYPSDERINQFCEQLFLTHDNPIISQKYIEEKFKENFQVPLIKVDLFRFIDKYNQKNTPGIVDTRNDEYFLLPTTNKINEFLNNLINEQPHDQPIQISILQHEFTKKFLIELDNNTINNFISFFDKNNKDIEIKRANYTELVIEPKEKIIEDFMNTLFQEKGFGFQIKISEIKALFKNQTTYDLPDELIKKYLPHHKKIQLLSNKAALSITYSEDDILNFIESFFTPGEYKRVYVSDIKDMFAKEFNITFPDKYIDSSFLSRRRIILEIDNNLIKSLYRKPSYKEIEDFLKNIFFNSSYKYKEVNLTDINQLYLPKFSAKIDETDLDRFLNQFPNIQIKDKALTTTLYCVYPTEEQLDDMLSLYIKQGDMKNLFIFSLGEIKSTFHKQYSYELSEASLIKWIKANSEQKNSGFEIEFLPMNVFMRRPSIIDGQYIQRIFDKSVPQKINQNFSSSIMQQLKSNLPIYGLSLRNKRNSNEIILTYDYSFALNKILNEISLPLRKLFLNRIVGSTVSTDTMQDFYKIYTDFCSKYDIELDSDFYSKLVKKANEDLLDIKIIYDEQNKSLHSEFKIPNGDSLTFGSIECPVCRNRYSQNNIGSHILNSHTSNHENISILTRNASNTFYCHHCKGDNIPLNNDTYIFTIRHIRGDCITKGNNTNNNNLNKNYFSNQEKGIWNGSTYSNNSEVLGNSGQLLRDNGRFGSFPSEDYYGDGDSNF